MLLTNDIVIYSEDQNDDYINKFYYRMIDYLDDLIRNDNYINKTNNRKIKIKKILTNDKIKINKIQYDRYSIEKHLSFELIYKEIPSRSLILCNIPEDTTEEDLKYLLTSFGDYQEIKLNEIKQGKVIVRFYDIRDAMLMRASSISIKSRSIIMSFGNDIEVINKKNPPNNGTIVVFNLPENVKDEDILSKFEQFGDIKDIRKTPNKHTQRFVEFYDSRSAFSAKKSMKNKKLTITGQYCHINIEFSLPGKYRINHEKFYSNNVPTIQRRTISVSN